MGFLRWGILAGNSLLSFVLGKNCLGGLSGWASWLAIPCFPLSRRKNWLGGLTWLEIAGILPQQDLPGWTFASGNYSLVSRCLVASSFGLRWRFLGACSAPALSWNSLFGFLGILMASLFLQ